MRKTSETNCGFSGSAWQSDYSRHYNWSATVSRKQADAETRKKGCCPEKLPCPPGGRVQNICGNRRKAEPGTTCKKSVDSVVSDGNPHLMPITSGVFKKPKKSGTLKPVPGKRCSANVSPYLPMEQKPFMPPVSMGIDWIIASISAPTAKNRWRTASAAAKDLPRQSPGNLKRPRPTYIMGDGRLCDGDFCAGFKYITCSGYKNFSNQAPVCNIQRPVSGKTIQVGTTIGFSAKAN